MSHSWRRLLACFLVLTVIATLCLGCGEDEDEEKRVTITIGEITDLSGPAGPQLVSLSYAVHDVARYYNEEGFIPEAKIEIVTYDTRLDPARDIPGYDWLRGRGAEVIITVHISPGEVLKPFSERDKVPLASQGVTTAMLEPPGWSFGFNPPIHWDTKTLLKWISEEHWDYGQGIPRVGFAGWSGPFSLDCETAMRQYCQDHPDKFEWAGGYMPPMGTVMWSGEVEKLKDCDFIFPGMLALDTCTFVEQFLARGYTTTFIGSSTIPSFRGFLVDKFGWEGLDGWLTTATVPWWNEPTPIVELIKQLVHRYHPGEAEELIHAGSGYIGGAHCMYALLDIVRQAVEEVGAESFDGQAFYNAAVKYKLTWEGYPEYSFSETKRVLIDEIQGYKWSAAAEDLVRASDWLPVVKE